MRRFLWVFLSVIFFLPLGVFAATYNGQKIDNKHFPAKLQLVKYFPEKNPYRGNTYDEYDKYGRKKEHEYNSYGIYDVDVVFVGKAAKIVFNPNATIPLPDATQNSLFLTLYLINEDIENPSRMMLKHTLNTSIVISTDEPEPDKLPTIAIWSLSLNIDGYKKKTESGKSGYHSPGASQEVHPDGKVVLIAYVKNLHYPSETDLLTVVEKAESSLTSYHYRKAIQKVHPHGIHPDKVDKVTATARHARDVKGFESGIVVDAKVWYYLKDH